MKSQPLWPSKTVVVKERERERKSKGFLTAHLCIVKLISPHWFPGGRDAR